MAGKSATDGWLVIDLGAIRWVHVDPSAGIARVGPGAVGGDLTQAIRFLESLR